MKLCTYSTKNYKPNLSYGHKGIFIKFFTNFELNLQKIH